MIVFSRYSPIFIAEVGLAERPDEFPVLLLQLLKVDLVRVLLLTIVAKVVREEYSDIVESVHVFSVLAIVSDNGNRNMHNLSYFTLHLKIFYEKTTEIIAATLV